MDCRATGEVFVSASIIVQRVNYSRRMEYRSDRQVLDRWWNIVQCVNYSRRMEYRSVRQALVKWWSIEQSVKYWLEGV